MWIELFLDKTARQVGGEWGVMCSEGQRWQEIAQENIPWMSTICVHLTTALQDGCSFPFSDKEAVFWVFTDLVKAARLGVVQSSASGALLSSQAQKPPRNRSFAAFFAPWRCLLSSHFPGLKKSNLTDTHWWCFWLSYEFPILVQSSLKMETPFVIGF